ncbi:MAG: TonB family protein [Prevotellaceae bacterium]|jgi:TonB family protein|nr:TonB family protein [Prevotellaceae bacterium]
MSGQPHIRIERNGRLIGSGLALFFQLLLLLFFSTSGFQTHIIIPQNQGIVVELLSDPDVVVPTAIPDHEPRALVPDPDQEVRLVQQGLNVEEVASEARTLTGTLGETGEVEVYEPPPAKPINERALFRSRDTADSLAEQSSRTAGTTIQAGPPDGNTREGNPEGVPSAALQGRDVLGSLPLPQYNANVGGTVVVRISVDQYGNVTGATVTQTGTTVQDKTLWDAAVAAAKKAKFNTSASAPVIQQGTITYLFRLK